MKIRVEQLTQHLKTTLSPIYLIHGDEPYLVQESRDLIYSTAREKGYTEKQMISVDAHFDWNAWLNTENTYSLFSLLRYTDLRFTQNKVGDNGSKTLQAYTENVPSDTILVISMPKLETAQLKSKWFQAIDKIGTTLQIWPISTTQLPMFIKQRLQNVGLTIEPNALKILSEHVEGNLLAAIQEIEKLSLLYGKSTLKVEHIINSIADNSRFTIFDLMDYVLEGAYARSLHILENFRSEGMQPTLILWGLARDIRLIAGITHDISLGSNFSQAVQQRGVWEKRQPLIKKAVTRHRDSATWLKYISWCSEIDKAIKGILPGNIWNALSELCLSISGCPLNLAEKQP